MEGVYTNCDILGDIDPLIVLLCPAAKITKIPLWSLWYQFGDR